MTNYDLSNPLVSIITTVFNGAAFLHRFFDSVLSQTYSRLQLVLVNDGSTDQTDAIVNSFVPVCKMKGVDLIYCKQPNSGLGYATMKALNLMTGSYFMWCNVDDYYDPCVVEKCISLFSTYPQRSIVRFNGCVVSESLQPMKPMAKADPRESEDYFLDAILERNIHFGCAMIRTDAFFQANGGSFSIYPSRIGQNWQLLLPVLYLEVPLYIDEPLFFFVQHDNSISANINACEEKRLASIHECEQILLSTLGRFCDTPFYFDVVKCKTAALLINYFYQRHLFRECRKAYKTFLSFDRKTQSLFYVPSKHIAVDPLAYYITLPIRLIRKWLISRCSDIK